MKNLKFKNYKAAIVTARAASLIYALVIVTILMIVAGSMSASFLRSSQRNYDLFRGEQAYYVARAALEDAFHYAHLYGVGYEEASYMGDIYVSGHAMEWDTTGNGVTDTYGDWEVFSRAKGVDWQDGNNDCVNFTGWTINCYLAPLPGTGEAGDSCDFTNPSDGDGDGVNWDADEDDKCNWNKIAHGQTISVPLFTEAGAISGTDEFILRLRTPGGETLDPSDNSDIIASWEFKGDCGGSTCYLRPNIILASQKNYIRETNINDSNYDNGYMIIRALQVWSTPYIKEGITQNNENKSISNFFNEAENIYFKLIVTGTLKSTGVEIPYLEYQIVTGSPDVISDNKVTYTADGYAEGRLGTYARHIWATQKLGNDSIINFALQN